MTDPCSPGADARFRPLAHGAYAPQPHPPPPTPCRRRGVQDWVDGTLVRLEPAQRHIDPTRSVPHVASGTEVADDAFHARASGPSPRAYSVLVRKTLSGSGR